MPNGSYIDAVLAQLRTDYGDYAHFGRSRRLFQFGTLFTCSINYSKELRGVKFFYGLSSEVLDQSFEMPATHYGHFVLLVCGGEHIVLWLPRALVLRLMKEVETKKLDVFLDEGRYILQTTGNPKLDVTEYLNRKPPPQILATVEQPVESGEGRTHSEIQLGLAKLGRAEGCNVWVPASDRNRGWKDESLRDYTSESLPNFGFDENTGRIVRNIDVLWLKGNAIQRAFEVEATTSIYSGLLRLNDLSLAQPNNRVALHIAAERSRRQRLIGQLMRPSFQALAESCLFVPFEDVREAVSELNQLTHRGVTRIHGLLKSEKIQLPSRFLLDFSDLTLS